MEQQSSVEDDIALLQQMIDGPDAGLVNHLAEHPYLRTAAAARADLASVVVALEDVRAGRVVPHEQILADVEARRNRHRTQAAE